MKHSSLHIIFSGGGTGGHLFPGLAVAERLAAAIPRLRITFCGSGKSFERKHVSEAGFDYLAIPARPLPGGPREAVAFMMENWAGYLAAKRFLQEESIAAVVGLGGYASVPMARAAACRRVPLVLLEQNAVPGKATRWLARRATLICTAFEETAARLRCQCPVRITGNPVRAGFVTGNRSRDVLGAECQDPARRQLLVLGGSGGARALNENVPRALYKIRGQLEGWSIVHQSGEADFDATRTLYDKFDLPATVLPFVRNMATTLAASHLAVCRAGGTTLAELAVAGVPAVLLPYPHATDNHQAANAQVFAAGGGCITIDPQEMPGRLDDHFADMLCFLLANDALRQRMSAAMQKMARPNAADEVTGLIWSIVASRSFAAEMPALA